MRLVLMGKTDESQPPNSDTGNSSAQEASTVEEPQSTNEELELDSEMRK